MTDVSVKKGNVAIDIELNDSYSNNTTRHTTNQTADGVIEEEPSEDAVDHIEGWVVAEDPDTGDNYYANIYTNETVVEKPQAIINWESKQQSLRNSEHENFEERKERVDSNKGPKGGFKKMMSVLEDVKSFSAVDKYMAVGRQASEYTFENAPYSPDAELDFNNLPRDELERIKEADFWEYIKENLNPRKKFFGKAIPVEEVLSHTTAGLDKPLTRLSKTYIDICGQTFKNIQSYTGDRGSSKPPIGHAKKLIEMGMEQSSEIRDEVFLQLIKMTRNNPNPDKLSRVWKLFAIITSVFYPSDSFMDPCLNYLYTTAINDQDDEVQRYARYCFKRMQKMFLEWGRRMAPSNEEIQFVEGRKQIMVPIYFLTGSHTYIPIESYSSAGQVKEILLNKLQFDKSKQQYVYLYEICEKNDTFEERFIENEEKVSDLLSMWDTQIRDNPTDKMAFKIYMKIRVYYKSHVTESDPDANVMYYTQTVYDIINGRIPITEDDALYLAGLQLHVDWGRFSEISRHNFLERVDEYIPRKMIGDHSPNEWLDLISDRNREYDEYDKQKARLFYLDYCKKYPLYLSHQYFAQFQSRGEDVGVEYPKDVIIAITPEALIIANEEREIITTTQLHHLITWGISTEFFVPVTGDRHDQEKTYFQTTHSRQIDFLLQSYTSLKLGVEIPASVTKVARSTRNDATTLNKSNPRNAVVFRK